MVRTSEQIAQLESAIAAQEKLRPLLGDDSVDRTLASLRAKLDQLRAEAHTAEAQPDSVLDGQLQRLEAADLVRLVRQVPDLEYIFKHALTQEAAYKSLLLKERRLIHHVVAQCYETLYADRLADVAAVLTHHYAEAGDDEQTFSFARYAGDAAARVSAISEARAHYARAVDALTRLPDSEDNRQRRIETIISLVSVALLAEGPEQQLARLDEAERLAQARREPDVMQLARIRYWRGRVQVYNNQIREALSSYEQVLSVAEQYHDERLRAEASQLIGRSLFLQGYFGKAIPFLMQALPLVERSGNWTEWIFMSCFLGVALTARGQYRAGVAAGERALACGFERRDWAGVAGAQCLLSFIHLIGAELGEALREVQAAHRTAEQVGNLLQVYMDALWHGWIETRRGASVSGFEYLERADALAQALGGHLIFKDWLAAARAEALLKAGRFQEACIQAGQALTIAQDIDGVYGAGLAHRVWGQALAALTPPRWAEAEAHLAQSVESFELGEAHVESARAHVAWALVCRARQRHGDAHVHIQTALAMLEQTDLRDELERARALADELESKAGR